MYRKFNGQNQMNTEREYLNYDSNPAMGGCAFCNGGCDFCGGNNENLEGSALKQGKACTAAIKKMKKPDLVSIVKQLGLIESKKEAKSLKVADLRDLLNRACKTKKTSNNKIKEELETCNRRYGNRKKKSKDDKDKIRALEKALIKMKLR